MNDNIIVSAEAHSDDHKIQVRFDATTWFEQAGDEEINDLMEIHYGGNLAADRVADFFEKNQTKRLFDYLSFSPTMADGDTIGFECNIDQVQAEAWIEKNRPHLMKKEYRFVVTGGIDVKGAVEVEHDSVGDIVGLKTSDGRTIKLVVGFEIKMPSGRYEYLCGDDLKAEEFGITELMYSEARFVQDD